jgi:hypothetical protein
LKEVKAGLCFVFLVLCAVSMRAQQNDWLVVPGERLGPIPSDITRAGLERLFGNAQVRDQPVESGEGPEQGTVVFPETPGATLGIFWRDSRMVRVMICNQSDDLFCRWHTKDGVSLGTSLERLEALNGRAFQISWREEGGWFINSWRGGRMAGILGDGPNNRLGLRLGVSIPSEGPTPQQRGLFDEIDALKRLPLSSDPAGRKLHPVVGIMVLDFMLTTGR